MNTKKFYVTPAIEAVEIKAAALLAGSGELGVGGTITGRGDLEDPEDDD